MRTRTAKILLACLLPLAVLVGIISSIGFEPADALAQDPPLGPTLVTSEAGVRKQSNTKIMNFASGCTVTASGTTAIVNCTGGGGGGDGGTGGSGTVTQIDVDPPIAATPDPITTTGTLSFSVTSQANGDLLFYNSGWNNRLPIGSLGRVTYSDGTLPAYSDAINVRADLTPGTSGTVDTTVITLPAGLGTNTNGILISDLTVRVRQAIVSSGGDGKTTLAVGTSAGGVQYIACSAAACDITPASAAGTVFGLDTSTIGAAFTVTNMFNAVAAGSSAIVVRTVTTGDVDTPALLTIHLNAEVL